MSLCFYIFFYKQFFNIVTCFIFFYQKLVCSAVKIHSITVPSTYVLKSEEPNSIVLDCDYTADEAETGFVLKWLLNNVAVYQWIPSSKTPFALVNCLIINS